MLNLSIGERADSTTGRSFLDFPASYPQEEYRALMLGIINNFIDAHVRKNKEALEELDRLLDSNNPLIAQVDRK